MSYAPYKSYRETEIEWFGSAPDEWRKTRLKFLAKFFNGAAFKPADWGESGLPIIRIAQLTGKPFDNFFDGELSEKLKVSNGDLLFSWSATIDCFIWSRGSGWLNQHIFRVVPTDEANKKYLYYLIKTVAPKLADFDAHGSTMRHIKKESLSEPVFVPSVSDQKLIADALDKEVSRIDRLIAEKAGFINLLKEKRQALISHVVTKGLDSDVKMKDSGVEWIGEIPEHWEIKRLRYLGRCQNGINIGGDFFGEGFPFISYGDVYKNRELPNKPSGLVRSSDSDRNTYTVQEGDVLFTRTSETIDEIGFSSVCMNDIPDAVFAGFLIRFRPNPGAINKNFSKYYFQNELLRAFFVKEMNLVTRASLSQELLKRMPVVLPPAEEQALISEKLDKKCSALEELMSETKKSIELLKEHRTALISAAVTGKIDLRDKEVA